MQKSRSERLKLRGHFEAIHVNERIILKWVLEECGVKERIVLICPWDTQRELNITQHIC
jgi:hypothetical protein